MDRRYDKEDIYDYLLQCYGLKWEGFKVYEKLHTRPIQVDDYKKDMLRALVVLLGSARRHVVNIRVSNEKFNVFGIEPLNDIGWQDFLAQRYSQGQNQDKSL